MGSTEEQQQPVAVVEEASPEIIFQSKLPDIAITNTLPLHRYCFERLPEVADRPCLIDGATGAVLTYAEVNRLTRRLAVALRRAPLGLGRGVVVMNLMLNSAEFVLSFFAASRVGAAIAASGATVVFTESMAVDKIPVKANGGLTVVLIDARRDGCLHFWDDVMASVPDDEDQEPEEAAAGFDPDDVVELPYSSGTTGLPKGVMLTHRSLSTSVAQQVDGDNPNIGFTADDVILFSLPMFHIYSLNTIMMCGLRVGAAIVVMRRFDLARMMELVERHRITIAPLVPPIVVASPRATRPPLTICPRSGWCSPAPRPWGRTSRTPSWPSSPAPCSDRIFFNQIFAKASTKKTHTLDIGISVCPVESKQQVGDGPVLLFDDHVHNTHNAKSGYGMTEAGPVLSMCLAFAKEPFKVKASACGTVVRNAELKIVDPDTGKSLARRDLHQGPADHERKQVEPEMGEIPVAFVAKAKGSELSEDDVKQFVAKEVIYYKKVREVIFVDKIPKAPIGQDIAQGAKEAASAAATSGVIKKKTACALFYALFYDLFGC
ncbi:unnamed protein product [Miscanthus lutarioriparius]|uniref:4-coumarate--CoA ligase n=1 Tax=Miscanthus lutarioriparius TaxID=422564 RepID=A0A811PM95_9POAL|nr:unnamed protein product [Miscanthus lutarioriparius]